MRQSWKYAAAAVVGALAVALGTVPSAQADSFAPPVPCMKSGHLSYTLNRVADPTPEQSSAYEAIDTAMKQAITFYNCYLDVTKELSVTYDPGVPTADANAAGYIRFGSRQSMQQITAMHEIAHTLGVGTTPQWAAHIADRAWTGDTATIALRLATRDGSAVLHTDGMHFWPFGLNQVSEVKSADDLLNHCLIMAALRYDMRL
jgi:hypothetical protein